MSPHHCQSSLGIFFQNEGSPPLAISRGISCAWGLPSPGFFPPAMRKVFSLLLFSEKVKSALLFWLFRLVFRNLRELRPLLGSHYREIAPPVFLCEFFRRDSLPSLSRSQFFHFQLTSVPPFPCFFVCSDHPSSGPRVELIKASCYALPCCPLWAGWLNGFCCSRRQCR